MEEKISKIITDTQFKRWNIMKEALNLILGMIKTNSRNKTILERKNFQLERIDLHMLLCVG